MARISKPASNKPRSRTKAAKTDAGAPLVHPEEMTAAGEVQIGKHINLKGTARITPAGAICAGIAGVAILLAAASLVRAARR